MKKCKNKNFENFVVGTPNELAFAAAKRVAEADFVPFNPLFLYGGVGLGKTHLLQAIGNQIIVSKPNYKLIYITGERFMFDFINSIQKNKSSEF